ncbi:hypothetical protein ACHAWF_001780 [Thalassiosira exigua]
MRTPLIAGSLFIRFLPPIPVLLLNREAAASSFFAAAMSTSASPPTAGSRVRVVSYNVLSSKLARPSHFTKADPEHLEFERRLPLVLAKLDEAMGRGFGGMGEGDRQPPPPTIFALQEVCYPFASALHTYFAQRGYHFVTGLYGRPFNGYMGVGIAYPLKDFETLNVDVCRLSDERASGWPREELGEVESNGGASGLGTLIVQKVTRTLEQVAAQAINTINNHIVKRLGYNGEKIIDPWDMSKKKFNILLTVALRHRDKESSEFCISNYHMPCAFFAPPVMNIHAEMAAKRVQDMAAGSWKSCSQTAMPYIFAGDFNILPDSPHYKLLTTGKLEKSDPTYPPAKHGVEWKAESLPMDSAYALSGLEPEFTNFAHVKDDPDPFIGTLDYIFLSKKKQTDGGAMGNKSVGWWKVHGVQKLPCKEESGGPFPNEVEPSDHYLIAADLELVTN